MNKLHLEAPSDPVLQQDLENIAALFPHTDKLSNCGIMVTGATGLVGSQIVKALACMNRLHGTNIRIFAFVRNQEKAERIFGELLNRGDIELLIGDISKEIKTVVSIDYLIHTASVTASKAFVTQPVETLTTALDGTRNVLEFAKTNSLKSLVYISSMEAYGITDPSLEKVSEKDLGYIDNLSVRSSYSEGKRACECLCAAYAAEYGVPVKIARLAQTFGAGVDRSDGRVFAQFTKSCMEGSDIVLHTAGMSMGNYCYTADAIRGILTILCCGKNGEAYTVVNESTSMRIKDVAQLVSDTLTNGKTKIKFDIPESSLTYGYAPDVTMRLSGEKLCSLGWAPTVDLPEMFLRLAQSFTAQSR